MADIIEILIKQIWIDHDTNIGKLELFTETGSFD